MLHKRRYHRSNNERSMEVREEIAREKRGEREIESAGEGGERDKRKGGRREGGIGKRGKQRKGEKSGKIGEEEAREEEVAHT